MVKSVIINHKILTNESTADITTEETNNAVIISLYGTSVLDLVTIIGFILLKNHLCKTVTSIFHTVH